MIAYVINDSKGNRKIFHSVHKALALVAERGYSEGKYQSILVYASEDDANDAKGNNAMPLRVIYMKVTSNDWK